MKIEDVINYMSKNYLEKIVKSFTNDIYTQDEDGYKKQILNNIDFLSDSEKIKLRLNNYFRNEKRPYQSKLITSFIIQHLLYQNEYMSSKEDLIDNVIKIEEDIISKSHDEENFKHLNKENYDILKLVLTTAFEDDIISNDEINLINKIRNKIGFHEKDQYLIQAKINKFPHHNNEIHTSNQINEVLNDLQKNGIIFYCNKMDDQKLIIPYELLDGIKSYMDIQLIEEKFKNLLNILNTEELRSFLSNSNLKQSGNKEEVIERFISVGIKPYEVMNSLSDLRLIEICNSLPDVKSKGSKDDKIKRIIDYFDKLINMNVDDSESLSEVYYKFFVQLAKKDMSNLIGKNIVKNEKDADNAFEKATTFIFEQKFNHTVKKQEGSEHSDGLVHIDENNILLWDNKSKMGDENYNFPKSHIDQFKKYIDDYAEKGYRITSFLVVVPDYVETVEESAYKLKYQSDIVTDVAIIKAEDLKWLSENWYKYNNQKSLNLKIFNKTGVLNKEELKSKLKILS